MAISQLNANDRLRATKAAAAMRSNAAYAASTTAPARQPDEVSLSESARSVSAARKAIAEAPDVRQDRIDALKSAIKDGTYSVDARQLALAMTRAGSL